MKISFLFPAALWLLLVIPLLWALAWATPRRRATPGLRVSLALRSALLAALVLALAGTRLARSTSALTTVFVVDRSASIAPAARARADVFVRGAQAAMRPGDRLALVAFGSDALVERAPADPADAGLPAASPVISGTNIQQAIELGLALLPAEANQRLVLLSDGGENAGDAALAGQLAAARGVPLSYVDLSAPQDAPEALLAEVNAPAQLRAGQSFQLTIVVQSTVAQTARVRMFADGAWLGEQELTLAPGENRLSVPVDAPSPGFHRYSARLFPTQDTQIENNRAAALVHVAGTARVLLVEGQPGAGQNLRAALAAAQLPADIVVPTALPQGLGALSAYEALVLINVPAAALPGQAMADLEAYVRELGRGLVMIGGDRSFGAGGYRGTPVEAALPVSMDAPNAQTRPRLAIVYLLDKSSSMDACHCRGDDRGTDGFFDKQGRPKLDLGKDAVLASIKMLNLRDSASVIAFDGSAHLLVPLQPNPGADTVQAAIGPVRPKGATNVAAGLEAAEAALQQSDAQIKHVVIMTDGWSRGGDPLEIAQRMRDQGMTLSVVAEGRGSAPFLEQLSQVGGGRFFAVEHMEDVPQIFLQETTRATSTYMIERPITPEYGAATPILAGLTQGLPQLYGYNGTTAKRTASVALTDADGTPILAQWQHGLGRAVAWTSDAKGQWARDWVRWPEFPRFAAQLVGWVLPASPADELQVELHSAGGQTTIAAQLPAALAQRGLNLRATVLGSDGARREVALAAQAAGVYQANIATPPQGSYQVQVRGVQGEQVLAQGAAGLVVPYSAEYRLDQGNPALLAELARLTGGAQIAQPAQAFERAAQGAGSARDLSLALLLLALALLPLDIVVRRLAVLFKG